MLEYNNGWDKLTEQKRVEIDYLGLYVGLQRVFNHPRRFVRNSQTVDCLCLVLTIAERQALQSQIIEFNRLRNHQLTQFCGYN